jgi:hypothetical protein
MTRRILRALKVTEISGVDRPAQAPARAVIFKRAQEFEEMNMNVSPNIDVGALALIALEGAAAAIRKAQPGFTREQAFAKACAERLDIFKIERAANRDRVVRTDPERREATRSAAIAKRENALDELQARADELRKADPNLSKEQAFAKVYLAEPDLAARERSAAREAMYA